MPRSIVSFGMLLALAFAMTVASLKLLAGSGPPSFTATAISRPMIVKILPLAASFFSFLCLIFANFECPDITSPFKPRLRRLSLSQNQVFRRTHVFLTIAFFKQIINWQFEYRISTAVSASGVRSQFRRTDIVAWQPEAKHSSS